MLDCSREDVRAHIRSTVRYLLSDEADALNADGFKIDMNYYGPVGGKHAIDNYEWGIGEKLWYELVRLIGTEAAAVKADAFRLGGGSRSRNRAVQDRGLRQGHRSVRIGIRAG
ncbi:hypothetical protein OMP38_28205 [Cohnella ginsengisoli]|uniref:Uncharacterized protein n=1 Tax=Cohnella ginsengisoli TaxID=425004 RepID=A0A9X4KLJ6_9BACL|nr:hypothetical protein [Cohnella ginsengisoli]MDG0794288.1 hypothetical protein [Cohnella ginsengisoli]